MNKKNGFYALVGVVLVAIICSVKYNWDKLVQNAKSKK